MSYWVNKSVFEDQYFLNRLKIIIDRGESKYMINKSCDINNWELNHDTKSMDSHDKINLEDYEGLDE